MRVSRAELEACRGKTLPDLLGPQTRLLFVGINPGLRTVAMQTHFGRPGNRFYPALFRAGIVERRIDVTGPMSADDRAHVIERGVGITNIVPTASARADELTRDELLHGAQVLADKVARIRPNVVAVLGVTAYRGAFGRPRAAVGRQPHTLGGAELWVAPNPSGLNAHSSLDALAAAYREIAVAAGIVIR